MRVETPLRLSFKGYILKLYKLHVYIAFIKLLVYIFEKQLERARYIIIYTRENR